MKYMESDLRSLKEPLRTEKLKEFREHTYQIADGFLKEIEVSICTYVPQAFQEYVKDKINLFPGDKIYVNNNMI